MKYSAEKKKAIVLYILEKISSGTQSLSSVVAEAFGISTNTVHGYLNELIADKIIEKHKRGEYALVTEQSRFLFKSFVIEISFLFVLAVSSQNYLDLFHFISGGQLKGNR